MDGGTGRRNWRQRWADRQNEKRRRAFDASFAAWQRDDHETRQMLAAAQAFQGVDAAQVASYVTLHRGETAYWFRPGVALVETTDQLSLGSPGYADFFPYPTPAGPTFAGAVIDTGLAVVTNRRIVLVGAHRREWAYTKLVGLTHLDDQRTTLMRVTNRVKISGLAMDTAAVPSFRFNVALALADFANDRPGFVSHLHNQVLNHQMRRPAPPVPATPQDAPPSARLGPGVLVGAAVMAVLVLCGLVGVIGLFAPPTDSDSPTAGQANTAATTAATQPPPSPAATVPSPTISPGPKPSSPRPISTTSRAAISPARPAPARTSPTHKPAPKRTASPAKSRTVSLCGAPRNPYGYNYCGRGSRVRDPKPDICSYFDCIPAFWDGVGYMIECDDGMTSMSGGRRGSCSHHGGNNRTVYDD